MLEVRYSIRLVQQVPWLYIRVFSWKCLKCSRSWRNQTRKRLQGTDNCKCLWQSYLLWPNHDMKQRVNFGPIGERGPAWLYNPREFPSPFDSLFSQFIRVWGDGKIVVHIPSLSCGCIGGLWFLTTTNAPRSSDQDYTAGTLAECCAFGVLLVEIFGWWMPCLNKNAGPKWEASWEFGALQDLFWPKKFTFQRLSPMPWYLTLWKLRHMDTSFSVQRNTTRTFAMPMHSNLRYQVTR